MRQTEDLIDKLAADASAFRPARVVQRLVVALSAGVIIATALAVMALNAVPVSQWGPAAIWIKLAYAAALAVALVDPCARLARPGIRLGLSAWWPILPAATLAALAIVWLSSRPSGTLVADLLGGSALFCPVAILALAIPTYLLLSLTVRRLAPVRLRRAGLVIGLLAGTAGASGYAVTCTEGAPSFVALWYTAGILLSGLGGWLTGPRLLRW